MRHSRIEALGFIVENLNVEIVLLIDLLDQRIQRFSLFRLNSLIFVLPHTVPLLHQFKHIHILCLPLLTINVHHNSPKGMEPRRIMSLARFAM